MAQGIGEAICHRFADEGANVVVAELESDNGEGTAADINSNGGTAMFCQTDTSDFGLGPFDDRLRGGQVRDDRYPRKQRRRVRVRQG